MDADVYGVMGREREMQQRENVMCVNMYGVIERKRDVYSAKQSEMMVYKERECVNVYGGMGRESEMQERENVMRVDV